MGYSMIFLVDRPYSPTSNIVAKEENLSPAGYSPLHIVSHDDLTILDILA